MFIAQNIIVVICVILYDSHQSDIAREVEDGVELLQIGRVELIIPDILSFTVKSPGKFAGEFRLCYAAKTTIDIDEMEYLNHVYDCPSESCLVAVYGPREGHKLRLEMRGPTIFAEFRDSSKDACPRLVIDNHQYFTILKLPQVPVIVNGAKLAKQQNTKSNSNLKWIIAICATLFLVLLVVSIIGFCICMRSKKQPVLSPQCIEQSQRIPKSPFTLTSH